MSDSLADQLAKLIGEVREADEASPNVRSVNIEDLVIEHSDEILSALRAAQFAQVPATIQELEAINRRLEGDDI
jgi:hypothetical protein